MIKSNYQASIGISQQYPMLVESTDNIYMRFERKKGTRKNMKGSK